MIIYFRSVYPVYQKGAGPGAYAELGKLEIPANETQEQESQKQESEKNKPVKPVNIKAIDQKAQILTSDSLKRSNP